MADYADIVEIIAPDEAVAGSRVDITVKIKNLYSATIGIMVGGALEYGVTPWPGIEFPTNWANVAAGETEEFAGHFTMPDSDVTIHAYSYWYGGGEWHFDDEETRQVTAGEAPTGTITRMELEHDESRVDIPAEGIPQGERGLVHVWGRNDTGEAQQMGIYWLVRDPNGYEVEEYSDWEAWPYTGAGDEHEFIGGRFDLNRAGRYTILAQLYIKVDGQSPVLDEYSGALCDVGPAEAEFANVEITKYERR